MRSDLLASLGQKRKPVPVQVPGVSSTIYVRPWTVGERVSFLAWRQKNPGHDGLCEKLFVLSVCDAEGKRLFEDTPEDIAIVNDLDGAAVQAVAERSVELNGLGDDSPKA